MTGNKHKNGIICMFPGCTKQMRTQKFKGHFTKLHLKEGEEYTIEHRRRYEVARTVAPSDASMVCTTSFDTIMEMRSKQMDLESSGVKTELLHNTRPIPELSDTVESHLSTTVLPVTLLTACKGCKRTATEASKPGIDPAVAKALCVVQQQIDAISSQLNDMLQMQRRLIAAVFPDPPPVGSSSFDITHNGEQVEEDHTRELKKAKYTDV